MKTRSQKRTVKENKGDITPVESGTIVNAQSKSPIFNIHIHLHSPNVGNLKSLLPQLQPVLHLHLDNLTKDLKPGKSPRSCNKSSNKTSISKTSTRKKQSKKKKEDENSLDQDKTSEISFEGFNPLYTSSQKKITDSLPNCDDAYVRKGSGELNDVPNEKTSECNQSMPENSKELASSSSESKNCNNTTIGYRDKKSDDLHVPKSPKVLTSTTCLSGSTMTNTTVNENSKNIYFVNGETIQLKKAVVSLVDITCTVHKLSKCSDSEITSDSTLLSQNIIPKISKTRAEEANCFDNKSFSERTSSKLKPCQKTTAVIDSVCEGRNKNKSTVATVPDVECSQESCRRRLSAEISDQEENHDVGECLSVEDDNGVEFSEDETSSADANEIGDGIRDHSRASVKQSPEEEYVIDEKALSVLKREDLNFFQLVKMFEPTRKNGKIHIAFKEPDSSSKMLTPRKGETDSILDRDSAAVTSGTGSDVVEEENSSGQSEIQNLHPIESNDGVKPGKIDASKAISFSPEKPEKPREQVIGLNVESCLNVRETSEFTNNDRMSEDSENVNNSAEDIILISGKGKEGKESNKSLPIESNTPSVLEKGEPKRRNHVAKELFRDEEISECKISSLSGNDDLIKGLKTFEKIRGAEFQKRHEKSCDEKKTESEMSSKSREASVRKLRPRSKSGSSASENDLEEIDVKVSVVQKTHAETVSLDSSGSQNSDDCPIVDISDCDDKKWTPRKNCFESESLVESEKDEISTIEENEKLEREKTPGKLKPERMRENAKPEFSFSGGDDSMPETEPKDSIDAMGCESSSDSCSDKLSRRKSKTTAKQRKGNKKFAMRRFSSDSDYDSSSESDFADEESQAETIGNQTGRRHFFTVDLTDSPAEKSSHIKKKENFEYIECDLFESYSIKRKTLDRNEPPRVRKETEKSDNNDELNFKVNGVESDLHKKNKRNKGNKAKADNREIVRKGEKDAEETITSNGGQLTAENQADGRKGENDRREKGDRENHEESQDGHLSDSSGRVERKNGKDIFEESQKENGDDLPKALNRSVSFSSISSSVEGDVGSCRKRKKKMERILENNAKDKVRSDKQTDCGLEEEEEGFFLKKRLKVSGDSERKNCEASSENENVDCLEYVKNKKHKSKEGRGEVRCEDLRENIEGEDGGHAKKTSSHSNGGNEEEKECKGEITDKNRANSLVDHDGKPRENFQAESPKKKREMYGNGYAKTHFDDREKPSNVSEEREKTNIESIVDEVQKDKSGDDNGGSKRQNGDEEGGEPEDNANEIKKMSPSKSIEEKMWNDVNDILDECDFLDSDSDRLVIDEDGPMPKEPVEKKKRKWQKKEKRGKLKNSMKSAEKLANGNVKSSKGNKGANAKIHSSGDSADSYDEADMGPKKILKEKRKEKKSLKRKKARASQPSEKAKKSEKKTESSQKSTKTFFENEDYISLNVEGPTKFAVVRLERMKSYEKHDAMNFREKMLFGDRIKRFSSSETQAAYKLKQEAAQMHTN